MADIIDWVERRARALNRTQKKGTTVSEALLERPVSERAGENTPPSPAAETDAKKSDVVLNEKLLDQADKRAGARIAEFTKQLAADWSASPK